MEVEFIMKKATVLTVLISLCLVACDKKPEDTPKIPIIVTNSSSVQTQVMTPLPPPVAVPQANQPSQPNQQIVNAPTQGNQNTQENKKVEFTPVVSKDNIPTPLPPTNQTQKQFNKNEIPDPTINDLGNNKTEVIYFGAKETIEGKFLSIERKPEGFLITTTVKKYFINY